MEEGIWPEAERYQSSLRRKAETADELPDLPDIPDGATSEERYNVFEGLAAEALAIIAIDPKQPASARVAASKEINDRAFGKSVAKIEVEVSDSKATELLEKAREIRRLRFEGAIDAEYEVVDNEEQD
jgi:hypothetical protein